MSKGLDQEGSFITNFSKIADTLILCAIWLVCCVPIVTVGASSCALYYAYHKAIRQDKGHPYRAFFGALKSNFWKATGIWLLMLVFTAMSLATCYLLRVMRSSIPMTGVFLGMGMIVVFFMMAWGLILFPYQARFENKFSRVLKNSAVITAANILWAAALLILAAAGIFATLWNPALCIPAVAIYLWLSNLILERIFRKVMTEEERISELEADDL